MRKKLVPLFAATVLISVIVVLAALELNASRGEATSRGSETVIRPATGEETASRPYVVAARFPVPFTEPRGVAAGPDGNIYVCGDESLAVLNAEGVILADYDLGAAPGSVTVDADGTAYLGFRRSVGVLSQATGVLEPWSDLDEGAIVTSIAVSRQAVYVADAGSRSVVVYDKDGMLRSRIDGGFIIPSPFFDVAVDKAEQLWVADTGRHALVAYDSAGKELTRWGGYAMDVEGFAGCCNPAHFAICPDGTFITAEKGLQRIKLLGADGAFYGLVAGTRAFGGLAEGLDIAVTRSGDIVVLLSASGEVMIFGKGGA